MKSSSLFKTPIQTCAMAGLVLAGSVYAAESQQSNSSNPWYVGMDAGVCLQQDVKLVGSSTFGSAGDKVQFDVGPRVNVLGGYNLNQSFAVEFETGFSYNKVSKVGGVVLTDRVYFYQVPALVNVVWNHKVVDKVTGFVGLGVGGVFSFGDAGDLGSDWDSQFAYQAKTGVKYALTDRLDLGFTYEFLGTTCHRWSSDSGTIKSDPTFSHSLLLGVTFKF